MNKQVTDWVKGIATKRTDAQFEYVDIKDYHLPKYNEWFPAVFTK